MILVTGPMRQDSHVKMKLKKTDNTDQAKI